MKIDSSLYRKVFGSTSLDVPKCKLCANLCDSFDVVDFNKICHANPYINGFSGVAVYYYKCQNCECIFTDFFDSWSTAEFSDHIYNSEYIEADPDYKFKRPNSIAAEWAVRFDVLRGSSSLDFGAGSGGFARAMNAQGFRFQSYDPYSAAILPPDRFDVVTAFEVIEHSPSPLLTFEAMLDRMGDRKILIVSQSLQPENIMEIRGSWWYIAPRNGHCTTYSDRSLQYLAARYGLTYVSGNTLYGFFSDPDDEMSRAVIGRLADWNR